MKNNTPKVEYGDTEYLGATIWKHKEDYDIMKQIDNEIVKQVNES